MPVAIGVDEPHLRWLRIAKFLKALQLVIGSHKGSKNGYDIQEREQVQTHPGDAVLFELSEHQLILRCLGQLLGFLLAALSGTAIALQQLLRWTIYVIKRRVHERA